MDEDVTYMIRALVAEQAAQRFVIDHLLLDAWRQFPRATRLAVAERLLQESMRSDHLSGVAVNDDLRAANLAEITERMQSSIDHFVGRALKTIGDAEDEEARRVFREGKEP
jgi:hypothetical protein